MDSLQWSAQRGLGDVRFFILIVLIREVTEPKLGAWQRGLATCIWADWGGILSRKHRLDKSVEARKSLSFVEEFRELTTVAQVEDLQSCERREVGLKARTGPHAEFLTLPPGLPVPDSQAAGQQELCGQEPGSSGDTGLHVSDLL